MSHRILIADDHRIVREGLRSLIEDQPGMAVVGEAEDGRKAVELASKLRPDVVIMDLTMPNLNGIEATRQITRALPKTRVIALSIHADSRYVRQMFEAGAVGYLLKHGAFEELILAIRTVIDNGAYYISPEVAAPVIQDLLRPARRTVGPPSARLTAREREVLQLMAEGKCTKEIANMLDLAVKTVETHRRQIMLKLQIDNIAELTKYAIREGLTPL